MAIADVYMLRNFQRYQNEDLLNVYFYQDVIVGNNAEDLVEGWKLDVLPKIVACQTAAITHRLVDAVCLGDPSNFFESALTSTGELGGDTLPAHNAVNFSLRINSRALRPGSRRLCGIQEEATTLNFITGAGLIGVLNTLRAKYKSKVLVGIIEAYQPIVVKRVPYEIVDVDGTHTAYRLPENDEELVTGDIVECLLNTKISHQVSRGNGR